MNKDKLMKIENMMGEVVEMSKNVEASEETIKAEEMKILDGIIAKCKGGFKFHKLFKVERSWNNGQSPEMEYFDTEKVIKIDEETYHERGSVYGGIRRKYVLYLTSNGELIIIDQVEDYSNTQNQLDEVTQDYSSKKPLDIFTLDEIIEGIEKVLEERFKELGDRTKTHQKRLDKIKMYTNIK